MRFSNLVFKICIYHYDVDQNRILWLKTEVRFNGSRYTMDNLLMQRYFFHSQLLNTQFKYLLFDDLGQKSCFELYRLSLQHYVSLYGAISECWKINVNNSCFDVLQMPCENTRDILNTSKSV